MPVLITTGDGTFRTDIYIYIIHIGGIYANTRLDIPQHGTYWKLTENSLAK